MAHDHNRSQNFLFRQYPQPVILDEIQRASQLLSYIQVMADESNITKPVSFISENIHLLPKTKLK
jgi:hypothetical protein